MLIYLATVAKLIAPRGQIKILNLIMKQCLSPFAQHLNAPQA